MTLGERLLNLRKKINLSQEEVAEKLNVTRQTISKWETDASTPDFDKIIPICNLYNITPDELLTGSKPNKENNNNNNNKILLPISIFMYFISIIWIIISEETLRLNEGLIISIFLTILGLATSILVYYFIQRPKEEKEIEKAKKKTTLFKQVESIIETIFLIIYLAISFITFAWHITWIIWIIYILIMEIIKLVFRLKGIEYEE